MRRLSIRWVLLGVAGAALLAPIVALLSLRSFEAILVRLTERELNAQGALVAAHVQEVWASVNAKPVGNPRDRWHSTNSYTPLHSRIVDISELSPPFPDPLPKRATPLSPKQTEAYAPLNRLLQNAQVFNLSGVRVLDTTGCTLASSRTLDDCYDMLPEVQQALAGRDASALRQRLSDEPTPALRSLSRRGDLRVFVAMPVWNDGEVIAAVLLSRTAESGLEWLYKQRRDIFYGVLLVVGLAVLVSFLFSRLISRPLLQMKQRLESGEVDDLRLRELPAPVEIHTLGVALDERAAQLEAKSRYIEEFAANVSHELKTPLTSIRGAVELLQEQGDSMGEAQRQRFLANIDAAAQRTDRLITRLLQLARLEARHEQDDDAVRIRDWLSSLSQRYGEAVQVDSKLRDERCSVSALESVIVNLVDNALRYRRSQPVTVSVGIDRAKLHVTVSDDGPGISPDNQKRLFERFFTTERDTGGTGLGLAIVLATAESRGGRAQVSSDAQGTTVEVWM